jgi:hypothetical protein
MATMIRALLGWHPLTTAPVSLKTWCRLLILLVLGGGVYGGLMGMWHGWPLALYVGLKLPLVLLITAALTLCLNWLTAQLLGLRLGWGEAALWTLRALATAALVLLSLAPVAGFFTATAAAPGGEARTTHNLLYLMHTALVGGAGLWGTGMLWRTLRQRCRHRRQARRIYGAWLLAFALVGGEVAWALRPFVGSIYEPVTFLRRDALDGNVYEHIAVEIAPYLLGVDTDRRGDDDD